MQRLSLVTLASVARTGSLNDARQVLDQLEQRRQKEYVNRAGPRFCAPCMTTMSIRGSSAGRKSAPPCGSSSALKPSLAFDAGPGTACKISLVAVASILAVLFFDSLTPGQVTTRSTNIAPRKSKETSLPPKRRRSQVRQTLLPETDATSTPNRSIFQCRSS